eukprot:GHVS01044817.1.p1 GENE.GHVS01044817.1~~GHVS01044817.1.p1  ORF type:complete len:296 (-),score=99.60 GHVS01044817.1:259-1146(-)
MTITFNIPSQHDDNDCSPPASQGSVGSTLLGVLPSLFTKVGRIGTIENNSSDQKTQQQQPQSSITSPFPSSSAAAAGYGYVGDASSDEYSREDKGSESSYVIVLGDDFVEQFASGGNSTTGRNNKMMNRPDGSKTKQQPTEDEDEDDNYLVNVGGQNKPVRSELLCQLQGTFNDMREEQTGNETTTTSRMDQPPKRTTQTKADEKLVYVEDSSGVLSRMQLEQEEGFRSEVDRLQRKMGGVGGVDAKGEDIGSVCVSEQKYVGQCYSRWYKDSSRCSELVDKLTQCVADRRRLAD